MAPGLRSGRTGRPRVVGAGGAEPGGRSERRTDAVGERRCLRSRWRAGAAGMLANGLLSVGMLSLLARCALAAEEKSTYDASGSSSLPSDPAVTAAPARPLAEEVPFSLVHSDGDSESEGEALSGQPAFSSVLTVMAGTGKHPASLDQSRTSPTVTGDETHTTQWPSHSFSQSSETSSSAYLEDGILSPSSGLTSSMLHQLSAPNVAGSSPLTSSSPSSSQSSSAPSTSSALPSFVSLFPLLSPAAWIKRAVSSRGQRSVFSPDSLTEAATLSPAGSLDWSDSLMTAQPTSLSDLPADAQGVESSATKTSPIETSTDESNKVTKLRSSISTSYHSQRLYSKRSSAQNQHTGDPFQGVQRQQAASAALTPAPHSAHPAGLSVSSHAAKQILSHTAYVETQDRTAADSQAYVLKITRDTIMSPLTSHVVNPDASPAITLRPTGSFITVSPDTPPGKASFFELAITRLTPIGSGTLPSEHASNPGDLLMAAGHGSPGVSAINMNYKQRAVAGEELKPFSTRAHQNHSHQTRPESVGVSILGSITRVETASHTPDSHLPSLPINSEDFESQTGKHTDQVPTVFSTIMKTMCLSGLTLPARLVNDKSYKTSPSEDTGLSAYSQVQSLHTTLSTRPQPPSSLFSHISHTASPTRSERAAPPAVSAFVIERERAGNSIHSTVDVETSAGNEQTLPSSSAHMSYETKPAQSSLDDGKESVPSGQLTARRPFFTPTKDVFTLNGSERPANEVHFTPATFDVASERAGSDHDVTFRGRYEQSSASWSEIISAPRASAASSSQGPITSVSSDGSKFYLGRQTTSLFTASSAAATSSSNRQNVTDTLSAIFSIGTKLMAPYTKWKATRPVPFQSSAFESENTSTGFDGANSNLAADGPSYEHPKLGHEREHNVHMLNSSGPTVLTRVPYSGHPSVGELPSFTYVEGTLKSEEQAVTFSPAYHRSAVAVQRGASVSPAAPSSWGSAGFLPLSRVTTDSVTSSQGSSFALVYNSDPSLADAGAVPLSNSPARSVSDARNKSTTVSKATRLTTHRPPLPSSSSSKALSGTSAYQGPSPVSSPGTASFSVKPVPPLFSSSSPRLNAPTDSDRSRQVTDTFVVPTEAETEALNSATSRAVALTFPKEKEASLVPPDLDRFPPTERTSQVPPLSPRQDATTASMKLTTTTVDSATKTRSATTNMPSPSVTTSTTLKPTPVTRRTTTTTTTRTQTSRRTFTPPVPRTSPPRGAVTNFMSPFTTTTEVPPQQCNITERMWVKTVVSIYVRRNRLDSIQRQNLRRGLSQGLRKALNDTSAQAQVETVFGSPNMTVAYHVTGGDVVYPPSVVLEALDSYGRDKLIADLRQYLPMVTALPLPIALWRPVPATGFQLKTVLQFVGAGDDPRSCRFSQMMEQRLEKVFSKAQAKVLDTNSRLSVQMLSVSQAPGSPAVSLVYTVRNGTAFINGTTASNLLGQLSAELVGYFLFYPPLVIAEPLEYHNLNTSIATRDFWVITVIQDVDNTSLEAQFQSFASLMEQRLAELFVLASQQGTRFRRATTVGSYTVQMVSIRRVSGLKNPAEMTYYIQHNGIPLSGSSAAKILNTVDSQTMALTLGYFVQLQAEPVVKNPPNNLWIIAAVLAPIAVVTLIIIIITAVLCRKNKNDFKADAIGNLNPRAKMAYRRDVGYYHQPVQGFDYAKQHLGQQGGDEETLPVSQDTLVMSLQIRDQPLSLDKALQQDGTANKKSLSTDKHKSKLPSEDGSVISNESEKLNSGRGLTVPKVTAQQKLTKEATRKRDDPYDTSSGSLQLISIKPMASQPSYSHPASSDCNKDLAIINGEMNLALKQKSDIEHYRNKLRLKAKRKGYYDFPSTDGSSSGPALVQRQRHGHERAAGEHGRPLEPDDERGSTYVKSHRRHSQVGQAAYRSRQSLSSPSPGGTEMDLLVMRERPRRGIRNSGYDTEPELIEETNVDRLMGPRGYMYGRGLKGHSETSTLSSQPSIDEVRQQMHLLLEEAFSLASGGQSTSGRHSHHHPTPGHYNPAPPSLPYTDVVTSAPGTMGSARGGLQWIPSYGADIYQCSLPKPAFRFTQLPEMAVGSPPPLPPRTGPSSGSSLRRSTSDLGLKGRNSTTSVPEMHSQRDNNPYGPTARAALPSITAEQPVSNYSGNPITAVYAIPATRSGYSEYFVSTPPTSYHSPSWMSYPPEPEDVPPQWADSVPLPGYVEAFPHPRYPQGSPTRLPLEYNQSLEQPTIEPNTASQQSLPQSVKNMDSMPLSSLSTSALVQAIRQEVAKLARKQNDMFEF